MAWSFKMFGVLSVVAFGCHTEVVKPPDPPPAPPAELKGVNLSGAQINTVGDVEFDKDQDTIRDTKMSGEVLSTIQHIMEENPMITKLRIEGHTDSDGNDAHNDDLSQRRALAVEKWLVDHGIDTKRIDAFGCGSRDPLVPNTSPENKQKNRRTEFDLEELDGKPAPELTGRCEPNPHRPK